MRLQQSREEGEKKSSFPDDNSNIRTVQYTANPTQPPSFVAVAGMEERRIRGASKGKGKSVADVKHNSASLLSRWRSLGCFVAALFVWGSKYEANTDVSNLTTQFQCDLISSDISWSNQA